MCGIVAVIGQIGFKEEKIFKQLLEVDSLRGRHSTGIIKVEADGKVSTRKKAVDGLDFVKLEDKFIIQGTNKILIGHNRHATQGAINDVNAHPFSFGDIHGVHNGTLTGQYLLKNYTDFKVDSENIYYDMHLSGIKDTHTRLRGAYALAWVDESDKTVNFIRNSERPLAMTTINDGKTVVVASESMMLEWVLARNGIDTSDLNIVENIDIHHHISLTPFKKVKNDKGHLTTVDVIKTLKVEKLEPYKATVSVVRKTTNTLKDYGLEPSKPYALVYKKKVKNKANVNNVKYFFDVMGKPEVSVGLNTYSVKQREDIEKLLDKHEGDKVLAGTLTSSFNETNETDLITFTTDVRKATGDMIDQAYDMLDVSFDEPDDLPPFEVVGGTDYNNVDDSAVVCKDPSGMDMTYGEFKNTAAYKTGCCCCSEEIQPHEDFVWYDEVGTEAICPDCRRYFNLSN